MKTENEIIFDSQVSRVLHKMRLAIYYQKEKEVRLSIEDADIIFMYIYNLQQEALGMKLNIQALKQSMKDLFEGV